MDSLLNHSLENSLSSDSLAAITRNDLRAAHVSTCRDWLATIVSKITNNFECSICHLGHCKLYVYDDKSGR